MIGVHMFENGDARRRAEFIVRFMLQHLTDADIDHVCCGMLGGSVERGGVCRTFHLDGFRIDVHLPTCDPELEHGRE